MSSHHVVREKQEPALLILSLNAFEDEQLGQLLEWSPTVIATADATEQLTVFGIKVDYLLGDNAGLLMQEHIRLIPAAPEGELRTAVLFLIAQNYPAVNIITDELDLAVYKAFVLQINLVIFCGQQKIYAIRSGFSKWKPAGEPIQLLTPVTRLQTTGLIEVDLHHYQTTTDGLFSLHFDEPYLFIEEEY